jgi:hypothetical protein
VDFLTGAEGIALYTGNGVSVLPARNTSMKIPYFSSLNKIDKAFYDALPVTRSLPVQSEMFISACEKIAEAIQRVGLNKEDPVKVAAETDKTLKELYGQK